MASRTSADRISADRILVGFHPVREGLRHRPEAIVEVLISDRRGGGRRREIEDLCRNGGVPLRQTSQDELAILAGSSSHNGFAAVLREEAVGAVPQTAPGIAHAPIDPHLQVLVEDIQDPRNLGALLRVCEGAGVAKVWIRDRGSAPMNEAVARTAAGATNWLDVERVTNSAQLIESLQKEGYWIYGAAAEGKAPWNHDLSGKILLCFGGEEKGLRERTRKTCDGLVGLPMRGKVESLNLATAAAACLYEAVRQRSIR